MTGLRFRLLIVAHLALLAATVTLSLLPPSYSGMLAYAYADEPRGWIEQPVWWRIGIIIVLGVLWIAAHVGLLLLRRWGRTLCLVTTPAGPFLIALGGPVLASGFHSALADIDHVLWGIILALAFYSPISARFAKPAGPGTKIR
jgi:hypothetical protein